jgi:hypothetical protein
MKGISTALSSVRASGAGDWFITYVTVQTQGSYTAQCLHNTDSSSLVHTPGREGGGWGVKKSHPGHLCQYLILRSNILLYFFAVKMLGEYFLYLNIPRLCILQYIFPVYGALYIHSHVANAEPLSPPDAFFHYVHPRIRG